jgi:hypothetical protein
MPRHDSITDGHHRHVYYALKPVFGQEAVG